MTAQTRMLGGLFLACALALGPARAQEAPQIDLQHFQPHGDRLGWFTTNSAQTLDLWQPSFGAWFSYARHPFSYYRGDVREEAVVSDLMTLDLQGAIGFGPADVALDIPVHLMVGGEGRESWFGAVDGAAFGDIRLTPKVRFLDPDEHNGIAMGVAAPIGLPTGNADKFVGMRTLSISPTFLVSGEVGMVHLGANLGARIAGNEEFSGQKLGSAFLFRLAASVQPHDVVEVGAEVYGDVAGDARSNPTEWLLGVTLHPVEQLDIVLAGGTALGPGIGAPEGRVVLGVGFSPGSTRDADDDGIPDRKDGCPEDPEDPDQFEDADGCPDPDNDFDGIMDDADACPNRAETYNQWQDTDGCPDQVPDTDGDGILDNVDECPNQAEDPDGFEDADGCPDPDNDRDDIMDAMDQCPNEAEVYNNVDDEDGCPDVGRVELDKEEIRILDKVHFDVNKAIIKKESYALLDDVAAVLQRFPNITLVQIQGHTDDQGSDSYNLRLSEARAKAVGMYIVSKGVNASRLVPRGYGETQPIEAGTSDEARAANRRVQFVILEQD